MELGYDKTDVQNAFYQDHTFNPFVSAPPIDSQEWQTMQSRLLPTIRRLSKEASAIHQQRLTALANTYNTHTIPHPARRPSSPSCEWPSSTEILPHLKLLEPIAALLSAPTSVLVSHAQWEKALDAVDLAQEVAKFQREAKVYLAAFPSARRLLLRRTRPTPEDLHKIDQLVKDADEHFALARTCHEAVGIRH